MLPHDFPPWGLVNSSFYTWRDAGLLEQIHAILRVRLRHLEDRDSTLSAAVVDSQSVKTTEVGGPKGYDAGKKISGRKRHRLVDTLGLIGGLVVLPVDVQDRDGAKVLLERVRGGCRIATYLGRWRVHGGGGLGAAELWLGSHDDPLADRNQRRYSLAQSLAG